MAHLILCISLLVVSNGFLLQWIRSMSTAMYTDNTSGTLYYPILFPNMCLCHLGTAHKEGDFVNLINTTNAKVEFIIFERILNGVVFSGFDVMALGH